MLTKQQIPTPALILDLDAFESNLALMADRARRTGKLLRPHAKAHKCAEVARRQREAGAIGVCVATVAEAEVMSRAGIDGLLLTSPQGDPLKIARAVETDAMVVVDHVQQVIWYEDAARASFRSVDVLIDLDVGDHRTGARSTQQAVEIGHRILQSPHLKYRGLQAYSVNGSHASAVERAAVSGAAFHSAAVTRDALAAIGLGTGILSGGSTGTWEVDTALADVTELQAGSYVFMDLAYRKLGLPFKNALTVLTTVVSANHAAFVTVDGGFKAFSTDRGYGPEAAGLPGSAYRWGGDEFGYLDIEAATHTPKLGDKIEFIAPHCDPTVNLHDRIYACRGEDIEGVWPVMERIH